MTQQLSHPITNITINSPLSDQHQNYHATNPTDTISPESTNSDISVNVPSNTNTNTSNSTASMTSPSITNDDGHSITPNKHIYPGAGTEDDPFVVSFDVDKSDPASPYNWSDRRKLIITLVTSISTLVVSFDSSCFAGAADSIIETFGMEVEVFTLGVSLYVLGFGIGPLFWAPFSEMYGRRIVFYVSYSFFVLWLGAAIGSPNTASLLIFRFLAGAFGSSTITNAGGTLSDMYTARQRGNALSVYALSVFCGPVLGPVVGGYSSMGAGWQWTLAVMTLFAAIMLVVNVVVVPETYAPVLLRRRAHAHNTANNHSTTAVHKTVVEVQNGHTKLIQLIKTALTRPLQLLFLEPIVLALAIWIAIIYGTLYLAFEAYPIVYQQNRGWNPGEGGLAFLSVGLGMVLGILSNQFYFNPLYVRTAESSRTGRAVPEDRLVMAMTGACLIPISLFTFGWTTQPEVYWLAPVLLMTPFGFGMTMTFMAVNNYLIDSYMKYAASALAANTLLRSCFGFAFPLFATKMYVGLGTQWASTLVGFLSLLCVPIPFVLYEYGEKIRQRSQRCSKSTRNLLIDNRVKSSSRLDGTGDAHTDAPARVEKQPAIEPNSAHDKHVFHHP